MTKESGCDNGVCRLRRSQTNIYHEGRIPIVWIVRPSLGVFRIPLYAEIVPAKRRELSSELEYCCLLNRGLHAEGACNLSVVICLRHIGKFYLAFRLDRSHQRINKVVRTTE